MIISFRAVHSGLVSFRKPSTELKRGTQLGRAWMDWVFDGCWCSEDALDVLTHGVNADGCHGFPDVAESLLEFLHGTGVVVPLVETRELLLG